jgi:hypothetical protein
VLEHHVDRGQRVAKLVSKHRDIKLGLVAHSNKPLRIAAATAAARSDTPSFS